MALPLLINGADCGPSNALQGLTKNFDHDRGLQQVLSVVRGRVRLPNTRHLQDFFNSNRAGSSREVRALWHFTPSIQTS